MHHQTLRSTVHWQNVKAPVQVVHKEVNIPFDLIGQDQKITADNYAKKDRQKSLALNEEVPFRMAALQTSEHALDVVWTVSHVLIDGWSCALVINEWIETYSSQLSANTYTQNESASLTALARWHKRQDKDKEIRFWDDYLPRDINKLPLPGQRYPIQRNASIGLKKQHARLEKSNFVELVSALQTARLNWVTAIQAAFCLVLQQKNQIFPSVFATTVAGRHIDLPGIDRQIGMLANMIPLCLSPTGQLSTKDWLQEQQSRFFSCLPYAHTHPQRLASIRLNADPLFQALLVIENQPTVTSTPDVAIHNYRSDIVSSFPLTLTVIPGDTLEIECRYEASCFEDSAVTDVVSRFANLLRYLPTRLEQNCQWLQAEYAVTSSSVSSPVSSECEVSTAGLQTSTTMRARRYNSATTSMTESMDAIWKKVLHQTNIDQDVSFFDLGGTSLQAIVIFERLEKELGITLPATTLFNAPTISSLVELIESQTQINSQNPQSPSVIKLHPDSQGPPLIIPFEQADMFVYQPMFNALGTDQPIIGLQIPQGVFPSEDSLNQLTRTITELYPAGSFRLAGLSSAGMVAWELAQRLTDQNRDVDLLVLLDSYGPLYPKLLRPGRRLFLYGQSAMAALFELCIRGFKKLYRIIIKQLLTRQSRIDRQTVNSAASRQLLNKSFNQEFAERAEKEIRFSSRFILETLRRKTLHVAIFDRLSLTISRIRFRTIGLRMDFTMFAQGTLLETCREQLRSSHDYSEPDMTEERTSDHDVALAQQLLAMDPNRFGSGRPYCRDMLLRYQRMYGRLQPYHGNVVYGLAKHRPAGVIDDPVAGWGHLLKGKVTVVEVPGNHTTMLKPPNVNVLGDALKKQLNCSSD